MGSLQVDKATGEGAGLALLEEPMDQAVAQWYDRPDVGIGYYEAVELAANEEAVRLLKEFDGRGPRAIFEAVKARPIEPQVIVQLILMAKAAQRTETARKAAGKRHVDTYELKAEAFKWFDANRARYNSLDATAEAFVAARLQPSKFRTVRKWVGEWKALLYASTT